MNDLGISSVHDLDTVTRAIDGPMIVVGHGIGGLVARQCAESGAVQPVARALLAPSPPAGVGGSPSASFQHQAPDPPMPPGLRHLTVLRNLSVPVVV
jgi:pimeloyl-ACP methyl ester carboxylesterase